MKQVIFKNYLCDVELGQYGNKCTAIMLVSAMNDEEKGLYKGEPIATASVNVHETLNENEIAIKVHSENEGMLEALQKAGIVGDVVREIPSGFVIIPVALKSEALMAQEKIQFGSKKPKP